MGDAGLFGAVDLPGGLGEERIGVRGERGAPDLLVRRVGLGATERLRPDRVVGERRRVEGELAHGVGHGNRGRARHGRPDLRREQQ